MKLESQLREAVPTTASTLDHADLQRRGRRRRWSRRAVAGLGGLSGILAVGVFAVSPTRVTVDVTAAPTGDAAAEPDGGTTDGADPAVVSAWDGLSHDDAVARLRSVLADHPERPDDVADVTVHGFPSSGKVSTLRADTPALAIVDVSDDGFVVGGNVDPVALLPAWTQTAASTVLDVLRPGDAFRYAGVVVDPQGRTVLSFHAEDSATQLWIDPASGYTVGAHLGGTPRPASSTAAPADEPPGPTPEPADS